MNEQSDTINLFDVGCLVNLRVGTWSGRKMITRADLIRVGYDPDQLPSEICNLGRKLLVPKAEIQRLANIEQRARKSLERWSTPFGICSAHFVPLNMLPTVEQQICELKKEFFDAVDKFVCNFDQSVQKIKDAHPEFWNKCLKGNYPSDPKALRRHFFFEWYTFKIAGMSAIQEVNVDSLVAENQARLDKQTELRTKMQEEVGSFVEEYVTSMRTEVLRFCDMMTCRVNGKPYGDEKDSKQLTPKSISCFRKYVDRFRTMNIFGDQEVEKMLSEFKVNFLNSGVSPKDFESSSLKDAVTKSLRTIRDKAAAEGESGSKFIGELRRKVVI